MSDAARYFADFWRNPISPNNSAFRWFLVFGLLIVIAFAWKQILKFITEV